MYNDGSSVINLGTNLQGRFLIILYCKNVKGMVIKLVQIIRDQLKFEYKIEFHINGVLLYFSSIIDIILFF